MLKYFRLFLLFSSLLFTGCSLLPEQKDKTAGWSAQKLYAEATEALHDSRYDKAVEYYQKLEARYPFGRYATQAQLNIAYAHYRAGDADPPWQPSTDSCACTPIVRPLPMPCI